MLNFFPYGVRKINFHLITKISKQRKLSEVMVIIAMNENIWLLIKEKPECDGKKVITNSNYFALSPAKVMKKIL